VKSILKSRETRGWCTKYALTSGIFNASVSPEGRFLIWRSPEGTKVKLSRGVNFFGTFEAASVSARRMAKRRIRSLERQIAALRHLSREPKLLSRD